MSRPGWTREDTLIVGAVVVLLGLFLWLTLSARAAADVPPLEEDSGYYEPECFSRLWPSGAADVSLS